MDFPTQNGLIGAAGGLVLGMIDYAIIARVFERMESRANGSNPSAMRPGTRELLTKAVGFMSFIAMPVVGYVVGETVL